VAENYKEEKEDIERKEKIFIENVKSSKNEF
jgi:hypothetical protein